MLLIAIALQARGFSRSELTPVQRFPVRSASECNHGFLLGIFSSCRSKKTENFCLIVRIGCLYFYCRYTYGNIYLLCVQHAIKKIGQLCIALFTPLITVIGNGLTFYYQKATFFKLETVKVHFHPLFDGCLGLRPLMIEGLSFSNCLNNTITLVFCL